MFWDRVVFQLAIFLLAHAHVVFLGGVSADGPFGLEMGMSKTEVEEATRGKLEAVAGSSHLYATQSVPKTSDRFATYALQILPEAGLCQIRALGVDIKTSSHGIQLRSQFEATVEILEGVYGKYKKVDRLLPGSIWDDPED